ncbi:glycoside hydrolase family 28 protein [Microbacter margulisiae]|uniref:Polygalacturonase n=1 Tax=Microbacter margulisiae TaxID=1350067 RepID=A0A7W5DQ44_9PORP|nr:glycoside hydrolase family 28 protein [Microbacter margulisiae]MBB3186971.1 polygalacturonase [Microbacter margulisiae]
MIRYNFQKTERYTIALYICIIVSCLFTDSIQAINRFHPSWENEAGAKTTFASNHMFNANAYGAKGDSVTLNSKYIQAAIDACAAKGGGIVTFKPGNYVTGSIFLKSGVTLRLDSEVVLLGSQNIKDYPLIQTRIAGIEMKWPAAIVNVLNAQNVAIKGKGIIDGRGKKFWDLYWSMRKVYEAEGLRWVVDHECHRPRMILISKSQNILLQGLQLHRSGFWTVQLLYSKNITVDGITIRNNIGGHGPSTDGIDVDSSTRILIEHCNIDCNDDDICLKAGRGVDGARVDKPTEYVVIRNCESGLGGGLIVFGSETAGSIRHVLAYNLTAHGTSAALRFKSAIINRGSTVEDVTAYHINAIGTKAVVVASLSWNPAYSYPKLPPAYAGKPIPAYWKVMLKKIPDSVPLPKFRNIYIEGLTATNAIVGIDASGMDQSTLDNFTFKNCTFNVQKAGEIAYAKNWLFRNVVFHAVQGNSLSISHSQNVQFIK